MSSRTSAYETSGRGEPHGVAVDARYTSSSCTESSANGHRTGLHKKRKRPRWSSTSRFATCQESVRYGPLSRTPWHPSKSMKMHTPRGGVPPHKRMDHEGLQRRGYSRALTTREHYLRPSTWYLLPCGRALDFQAGPAWSRAPTDRERASEAQCQRHVSAGR